MAGHNRLLRGNTQQIRGTVPGNTAVEVGDFLCSNITSGYFGNSKNSFTTAVDTKDDYLYPLSSATSNTPLITSMLKIIATQFVGVAMSSSPSGTTNEVVVAIDGIFRYPIHRGVSAVTVGAKVSAVSLSAGSGSSNQTVVNHETAANKGTTAYLGYIVKTESGASFVDFDLWSAVYDTELE